VIDDAHKVSEPQPNPRCGAPTWWDAGLVGLILLAVFLCFLPVLGAGFVWDDGQVLVRNANCHGLSASHLRWMFTAFHMGHYQPLTWVTHALDHLAWGENPFGPHLTNLVLHAANAVLAFFLIRAFLRRNPASLERCDPGAGCDAPPVGEREDASLSDSEEPPPRTPPSAHGLGPNPPGFGLCCAAAALFFAVHPLRVESVAWVTERRDVLSGFFFLAAVLAYLRMAARRGPAAARWYALALACFALSLLSKAWGITLPAVLLVLDVYPLRRAARDADGRAAPAWRRLVLEKAPFVVLAGLCAMLAFLAQKQSAMSMVRDHGLADRVMQAGYGLCFYLWKTLLPVRLSPLYLLKPSFDPWATKCILCLLLAAGVTVWLALLRHRWPWALAAWVCYAVIVSPVLGFAQSGDQIAADRYTYLACIPFAVLLGAGFGRLRLRRRSAAALAAATLAALGVLTYRQTLIWHDDGTLWERALALDPGNYVGYTNRGNLRKRTGDRAGAAADYDAAIRSNPDYALAHHNRGVLRREQGDLKGSLGDFDSAVRLNGEYIDARINRGNVRRDLGDRAGALADYDAVIRAAPESVTARYNRGNVRRELDDKVGALADYDIVVRLAPEFESVYINRGVVREATGDPQGALADYNRVLTLNPRNTRAYFNRAVLRKKQGDLAGALADYSEILSLDPKNAQAFLNRGTLFRGQGDLRRALADFTSAVQAAPALPVGHLNRGLLLLETRDPAGAVRDFTQALAVAPPNWAWRGKAQKLLASARARLSAKQKGAASR